MRGFRLNYIYFLIAPMCIIIFNKYDFARNTLYGNKGLIGKIINLLDYSQTGGRGSFKARFIEKSGV